MCQVDDEVVGALQCHHGAACHQAVCAEMKQFDAHFDEPLLSKMENGVCLPTRFQCARLAEIYDCEIPDLINYDFFNN